MKPAVQNLNIITDYFLLYKTSLYSLSLSLTLTLFIVRVLYVFLVEYNDELNIENTI